MTTPKFSAEVSIYHSTATYVSSSFGISAAEVGPAAGILPQMRATGEYWNCVGEHREAGFPMDLSRFFCAGEGDGSGPSGPREPVCRPSCTPCGTIPGQSGRWKTCIKRDCEDVTIRCR